MLLPSLRPALLPALQSALGSNLNPVALAMLTPHVDGTMSVTPVIAKSAPTFTRASTAYVQAWENVYRLAASGEARFKGARRVENLLPNSGLAGTLGASQTPTGFARTVNTGSYTLQASGYGGGEQADHQVATVERPFFSRTLTLEAGRLYRMSCVVESCTVAPATSILHPGNNMTGMATIVPIVSATPIRYVSAVLTATASVGTALRFGIGGVSTDTGNLIISRCMVEDFTATSNQNPSEYVASTTTATVARYFTTTNGNTVDGSNVVTAAAGLSLHPTHVADGVVVFDHYRSWVASTAYLVGQRIIPTGGAYTGAGNGYWYECTVAGTSSGTAPTWPTTGFGVTTVVDGGVTWRLGGYYRIGGYYTEGARTNSLLHSRALSNAAWVQTGTPAPTANAVGFDGVPNTAWTLTDDDAAVTEASAQAITIPNDANTHVASVFITKDAITSRFPELHVSLSGGTLVERAVQLNTQTGATVTRLTAGTGTVRVEDHGVFWRLVISLANNTSGNVTQTVTLRPAAGTTLGVLDVAATGSAVFDQAQVELNVATGFKIATSTIVTTTAAVTRSADADDISKVGHFDPAKGCALADYEPVNWAETLNARVIGTDLTDAMVSATNISSGNRPFNGATAIEGPAGTPSGTVRAATKWGGAGGLSQQVSVHGVNGAEITGMDDFDITTNIRIGNGASIPFFGTIKNVRLYTSDPGTTRLNSLTRYDYDMVA